MWASKVSVSVSFRHGYFRSDRTTVLGGETAVWDFSIGRALAATLQSWPYLLARLVVAAATSTIYLTLMGTGAGIGYSISQISTEPGTSGVGAIVGGVAGFGVAWFLFRLFAEYILYVVKAGHVAVLLHLLEGKSVPGARDQIAYGSAVVRARFAEASTLFVLDQLIKAVLHTISSLTRGVASMAPIPGLSGLVAFANQIVSLSLTYADEVVLAYNIRSGVNDPWETSRRGLVLYAQNGRNILKNAFWLAIVIWGIAILFFALTVLPAAAAVYWEPSQSTAISFAAAMALAWVFITTCVEPFAIACLMQVYFKVTDGQSPDPEWKARLHSASGKFRELLEKAAKWVPTPKGASGSQGASV